jgi:recombination protein RecT
MDLGQLGLEPDGRKAHLVPFANKKGELICTVILDYKGIIELAYRAGARKIRAEMVYENDEFDYWFGTGEKLTHRPAKGDRGKPVSVYSHVITANGDESFHVMSYEQTEAIRRRSKQPDGEAWKNSDSEMRKKTCFKQHSKWLLLSKEFENAVSADNENEYSEEERFKVAKPVIGKAVETPFDVQAPLIEPPQVAPQEKPKKAASRTSPMDKPGHFPDEAEVDPAIADAAKELE